jgi:hypothetical protein
MSLGHSSGIAVSRNEAQQHGHLPAAAAAGGAALQGAENENEGPYAAAWLRPGEEALFILQLDRVLYGDKVRCLCLQLSPYLLIQILIQLVRVCFMCVAGGGQCIRAALFGETCTVWRNKRAADNLEAVSKAMYKSNTLADLLPDSGQPTITVVAVYMMKVGNEVGWLLRI